MNCIFIYNPVSGRGKIKKKLNYIEKSLKEKYDSVTLSETKAAGDMSRMAREAVGKYDAIIFSGGDGSFNEVIQGIADLDNLPELGYIPSGTVNDIAHTLQIPCNIRKALRIIKTGRNELLDCMKVNDSYAMYVVAAGAFTSATYSTPQADKNSVGKIAYYVEGIKHNFNFDFFSINCDAEKKQRTNGMLVLFINSRYVSGFKVNEDASMQDGKIEATIIQEEKKVKHNRPLRKFFSLIALAILFLFGRRTKNESLLHLEGTKFDVDVDDSVTWNFDGEKGCHGKIHIEVVPRKINMIVPKNIKKL